MQKTALVILAAGLGSRYGKGVKQLAPVGPSGELIFEYAVHDALEAGFQKVVFIIRRDLEKEFKETVGSRIEKKCEVAYVFQDLDALPDGFSVPEGRTKPWGTGHALLLCRGVVREPFVVINSDDYYGKEAFGKLHDYLLLPDRGPRDYCMAGFVLRNTLSRNGSVTRGLCFVDAENFLTDIRETYQIVSDSRGVFSEATGEGIDPDSFVSMNMWGLMPEFLELLWEGFPRFLRSLQPGELAKEYLLPGILGALVREGKARIALLPSEDRWVGVTYAKDRPEAEDAFAAMVREGVYPSPLA